MIFRLILLLLCLALQVRAQSFRFERDGTVPVWVGKKALPNAWAGGLNAGQFATIHLNDDTIPDLAVFDRTSNKLLTFVAVQERGKYAYQHAPVYERQFPEVRFWVLLADYDQDGRKDLFTHTNLGIRVYRNVTAKGGNLSWEMAKDALFTQSFNRMVNLQVGASDIPALVDVDSDGDLDVLTFDFVGSYIEYHQNQSMEKYGKPDSLVYKRIDACWGNFEEGLDCGDFDFSINCQATGWLDLRPSRKDWQAALASPTEGNYRIQHAGSTLLALDLDGDGDKDILLGDVSCDNLFQMTNQGNPHKAVFRDFKAAYPTGKPIEFATFPAVFYEDLDFDGVKDLIAAPNVFVNEGNRVNFRESAWLYHNAGNNSVPDFQYVQNDFLQNTMIDRGENASPAFADFDGDGDLDLFIGHAGLLQGTAPVATLALYENTGTASQPAFSWRTDDYLQLSALKLSQVKPSFADVNGDGKVDLCLDVTVGKQAKLQYIPNTAAPTKPFRLQVSKMQPVPVTILPGDVPTFTDLDSDGDLDLLVGKGTGSLECYQNVSTSRKLNFRLENQQCGGLGSDSPYRNLAVTVADLNGDGKPDLVAGSRQGELRIFSGITDNLIEFSAPQTQLLVDYPDSYPASAKPGTLLLPTLADLNGDGLPEIILGTQAGGLLYLSNSSRR
jgi:hypothetical protein